MHCAFCQLARVSISPTISPAQRPDCPVPHRRGRAGTIPMRIQNFPIVFFVSSFLALWFSTRAGVFIGRRMRPLSAEAREDYNIVLTSTLTLLGLIIGFSFSMAISRYDQRKNYEEEETNAIGTEYVRAELLPAAEAAAVKELLRKYVAQRVLFYTTRDEQQLLRINAYTSQLQDQMWSVVRDAAAAKPSPTTSLAASGMNDVLNSQGYTRAAWLNRIPTEAWVLMIAIAICSNFLVGYGARQTGTGLLIVLPFVLAIAFFLVSDIDSPRRGGSRVGPQNLENLSRSLQENK
jgi:hypothetical protein